MGRIFDALIACLRSPKVDAVFSSNQLWHAMAGAVFLLLWKLASRLPEIEKRLEWVAGVAILLAYGGAKENFDREGIVAALVDVSSYVILAPVMIWAWGKLSKIQR